MSTFRAQFRTALLGILDDFKAANPTLIRQTYQARPKSLHPPCAYVGPFSEPTIRHEFGNRQSRVPEATLVLVEGIYENAETADKLDELADAMISYLPSQHARVSGSTLLEAISAEDVELDLGGGAIYAATIITVRLNAVA